MFSFESSSKNIVKVDNLGYLKATGYGSAKIKITAEAAGEYTSKTITVKVKVIPQKVKIKSAKANNGVLKLKF
ncbi:MAG: hypothetical protein K6F77_03020, partial [Lachnospiraceae bacterium]|nr:hypothetical protein [Lachnospiraceae bacterium]